MKAYTAKQCPGCADGLIEISGPGMPSRVNTVALRSDSAEYNTNRVLMLLNLAFNAGKAAARAEFRAVIGAAADSSEMDA